MKKSILFLLIVFICINSIHAQNVSETEKISSLIKIHGFLKYYHPEVGKGKFEWDKEFLNIFHKY
jgi:hypothetical protein